VALRAAGQRAGVSRLLFVAVVFVVAGVVKGVSGLGLPTVAVGLLSAAMPPAEAAALLVIPSLVTNVWQLAAGPALRPLLGRLWPLLCGICLGTWAGSGFLSQHGSGWATMALGAALIGYGLIGLFGPRLRVPPRAEPWLSPCAGAATGLVTAATGVFVIPAVPFLQALALEPDELVQALGLSFTVSTLALAADLARHGAFAASLAGDSVLALLPALLGMLAGQWVRSRVQPATFRRWFFISLLGLGAHLVLRAAL
jgi:uncharacterized membrane protein YfcA